MLALPACKAATPADAGVDARSEAGASSRVPLIEDGSRDGVGDLRFRGGVALTHPDKAFGGLSDFRVTEDGTAFAAVSDGAGIVTGRLRYDRDGNLVAAGEFQLSPLNGEAGAPLVGKDGDAEGLVRLPDGGWLVSIERDHRILRYGAGLGQGRPARLDAPADLASLPANGGLETLVRLADGRLLLIAEDGLEAPRTAAWIGTPGAWTRLSYQAEGPFRPVGGALMPDGDVLVLERRASFVGGWGSRIVRLRAADLDRAAAAAGGVLAGQEIGRLDPPMAVDNYEGIDVRRTSDGRIIVYLLSDDNFQATQRTLLLMFELRGG
ncbi:MAG: hypothetical protein RLY86_3107 [Pseudomonadota bacterium]|jgi:hypothetical protein